MLRPLRRSLGLYPSTTLPLTGHCQTRFLLKTMGLVADVGSAAGLELLTLLGVDELAGREFNFTPLVLSDRT
jgi:hypothetical protein